MGKGINDRILEKELKIHDNSIDMIVKITKGEEPFASTKISPDEVLWSVQHLEPEARRRLEQEFGRQAIFKLYGEAAEIMNRRNK